MSRDGAPGTTPAYVKVPARNDATAREGRAGDGWPLTVGARNRLGSRRSCCRAGSRGAWAFRRRCLPIDGHTFAQHIIAALAGSRVGSIYLVVGADAERICAEIDVTPARVVVNEQWELGQLSSLQAGLRALPPDGCDAVMMALVDHPLIEPTVVDAVIAAFEATSRPIVIPSTLAGGAIRCCLRRTSSRNYWRRR